MPPRTKTAKPRASSSRNRARVSSVALVAERSQQVNAAAQAFARDPDPAAGLFRLLDLLIAESTLRGTDLDWPLDVRKTLGRLLSRAQRAKHIRRDLNPDDVLALLAGSLVALERCADDERSRQRIFEVFCDGMRPH